MVKTAVAAALLGWVLLQPAAPAVAVAVAAVTSESSLLAMRLSVLPAEFWPSAGTVASGEALARRPTQAVRVAKRSQAAVAAGVAEA